jgi:hypothetical protein
MTAPVDPKDLPGVALQLIETIDELTKSINELLHRTARSEEQIARSERQTRWQWVVITAIAVLFTVQGVTTYQQVQTSNRLDDTRAGVLCPLFSVFLGSYNPTTRAAGADRETYEATFAVIRGGYHDLACTTPFVPPPTTRPAPPK